MDTQRQGTVGSISRSVRDASLRDVPRFLGKFGGHHGYALFAVARAPLSVRRPISSSVLSRSCCKSSANWLTWFETTEGTPALPA